MVNVRKLYNVVVGRGEGFRFYIYCGRLGSGGFVVGEKRYVVVDVVSVFVNYSEGLEGI